MQHSSKLTIKELKWLTENIDTWHFFEDAIATVNNRVIKWLDPNLHEEWEGLTKDKWLLWKKSLHNFNQ